MGRRACNVSPAHCRGLDAKPSKIRALATDWRKPQHCGCAEHGPGR
jgi:hypothetical protein